MAADEAAVAAAVELGRREQLLQDEAGRAAGQLAAIECQRVAEGRAVRSRSAMHLVEEAVDRAREWARQAVDADLAEDVAPPVFPALSREQLRDIGDSAVRYGRHLRMVDDAAGVVPSISKGIDGDGFGFGVGADGRHMPLQFAGPAPSGPSEHVRAVC